MPYGRKANWPKALVSCLLAVSLSLVAVSCGGGTVSPAVLKDTPTAAVKATARPGEATTPTAPMSRVERVSQPVNLTGAGATFPYPLYSKWFDEYKRSVDPNVTINYQSIGSGGGKKQIAERTVDFGATDGAMTDEELKKAQGILHIPTVAGAVVIIYNLPGIGKGLKLTPEAVSGIFLGQIKKWSDPRIAEYNPDLSLPNADIPVVHRSDGSGTTKIFTDYLSSVSTEWKTRVGSGTSVRFPVGIGAKGNEGVAGQVKQLPNSVGYSELAYADQNRLAYADILNRAGNFVEPTIKATTAAVAGAAASIPADLRATIVNPVGPDAYPISGFTWLLVYQEQSDQLKGQALVNFLWWALHEGERFAEDLHYAPLPENVATLAEEKVRSINFQGKPLLAGR